MSTLHKEAVVLPDLALGLLAFPSQLQTAVKQSNASFFLRYTGCWLLPLVTACALYGLLPLDKGDYMYIFVYSPISQCATFWLCLAYFEHTLLDSSHPVPRRSVVIWTLLFAAVGVAVDAPLWAVFELYPMQPMPRIMVTFCATFPIFLFCLPEEHRRIVRAGRGPKPWRMLFRSFLWLSIAYSTVGMLIAYLVIYYQFAEWQTVTLLTWGAVQFLSKELLVDRAESFPIVPRCIAPTWFFIYSEMFIALSTAEIEDVRTFGTVLAVQLATNILPLIALTERYYRIKLALRRRFKFLCQCKSITLGAGDIDESDLEADSFDEAAGQPGLSQAQGSVARKSDSFTSVVGGAETDGELDRLFSRSSLTAADEKALSQSGKEALERFANTGTLSHSATWLFRGSKARVRHKQRVSSRYFFLLLNQAIVCLFLLALLPVFRFGVNRLYFPFHAGVVSAVQFERAMAFAAIQLVNVSTQLAIGIFVMRRFHDVDALAQAKFILNTSSAYLTTLYLNCVFIPSYILTWQSQMLSFFIDY